MRLFRQLILPLLLFGTVVGLWAGYQIWIEHRYQDAATRGQHGDMFGGLNALFSGLAFAGLIYTILLQSEELSLQRRELELTRREIEAQRQELARQASLMEEQLKAARDANRARNLVTLNEVVMEESFRQARGELMRLHGKPYRDWTPEEKQICRRACATWNFVAILVLEIGVPQAILDGMRYTVTRCHEAAAEFLKDTRAAESPDHWQHFTRLANDLSKIAS